MLPAALPPWPSSQGWGWCPGGALALLVATIVLIFAWA
ncbi:MAG: DUF3309 family protein [Acetobacteraceae bacterium]|nr:DUF3309 family protein [Acetobacteraceae bacterium]